MSIGEIWGQGISAASTRAARMSDKHTYERQWNREFAAANSAHQREVQDLRLAGLNPLLSAGASGANAPNTSHPPDPGFGIDGIALSKLDAEIENIKANTRQTSTLNRKTAAEAGVIEKGGKILEDGLSAVQGMVGNATSSARKVGSDIFDATHKKRKPLTIPIGGKTQAQRKAANAAAQKHKTDSAGYKYKQDSDGVRTYNRSK